MNIKKVLNNGNNKLERKVSFVTTKGIRTPKEIWIGECNDGSYACEMTKKNLLAVIERYNRKFCDNGQKIKE